MKIEDVIIIGAGPAGIAAAIQLKRQGQKPLVFEKNKIGGLLHNANLVENYPGFPGGITGVKLVALFDKQLADHSINPVPAEVTNLDFKDDLFCAEAEGSEIHSRFAILASGTRPRKFTDIVIPDEILPRIHYEIYPLLKETGKRVIIVGAGDAAFDYALNLSTQNEVIILNRGRDTQCLSLLENRAGRTAAISCHRDTSISKISQNSDGRLRIDCMASEKDFRLEADYLIFAIGRDPQLEFLSAGLKTSITDLEIKGRLYRLGDVKNDMYRQTAIAVGDAVKAAMTINRKLTEAK